MEPDHWLRGQDLNLRPPGYENFTVQRKLSRFVCSDAFPFQALRCLLCQLYKIVPYVVNRAFAFWGQFWGQTDVKVVSHIGHHFVCGKTYYILRFILGHAIPHRVAFALRDKQNRSELEWKGIADGALSLEMLSFLVLAV